MKMSKVLERLLFPAAIVCFLVLQVAAMADRSGTGRMGAAVVYAERSGKPDTIKYRNQFIKDGAKEDTSGSWLSLIDTTPRLSARDTIFPPDSLRMTDPFRYKYYVAIMDSLTHLEVKDSLKAAGDSVDWPRLDSLYVLEYNLRKKAEFDKWYGSLSKTERKKYDSEVRMKAQKHRSDSITAVRDSIKGIKDSIAEATPRILETFALPDSMQYKRIVQWSHDKEFHKMHVQIPDTGYNYRFNDFPFMRKDVNATWLGVAGSAVQYYNFFNRTSENNVAFYDPYEAWTYSRNTLPFYNTKTPYTVLSYTGTLLSDTQKESDNLHILTTQNIFPELNFSLEYNRFGGNGIMENEKTSNGTFSANVNYLGKRYLLHAGVISNTVDRRENGGTADNTMVTDTTLDAREYPVFLSEASTKISRRTYFVDQQYRIPFTFLKRKQVDRECSHYRDSILAFGDTASILAVDDLVARRRALIEAADSTGDTDITSAFIGHSSEYSWYSKLYKDAIGANDAVGRAFYDNVFNYSPTTSFDSVKVTRLENRIFLKLQPWKDDAIISKVNGGVGNRIQRHYVFDPTYIRGNSFTTWNSSFVYAGAEGKLKDYISWNATGEYVFVGHERNDFTVKADSRLSFKPFRRDRKSPVNLDLHFETSLKEPDFYHQHYYSNHYSWENDFSKVSTTKVQARLAVPKWDVAVGAGYALLANNIYFDTTGVVRQNGSPMSVLSVSLDKDLSLFGFFHLDNRLLFQVSSDQDVLPLPTLAVNSRIYIQFPVKKDVMMMQIGGNVWYNTEFYSPSWNPAVGAFYNQKEVKYNNGPVIDAFVNVQWKRACVFIKYENAGLGWPMDKADYFSANHYIRTQRAVKFGIYWPFYRQPFENKQVTAGSGLSGGGGSRSGGSAGRIGR